MPADTTHPVFQPRQPNNDCIKVWRYMNLPKFIGLLQSRALYLARADTLGDPFEGSLTEINRLANEDMITRMLADSDGRHTRGDVIPARGVGIMIPIDPGKIIDDIRAYPGAPMWIREMLTGLVRGYGLELDVSPSRLDATPTM
ncbi:MAG: hypothetical protein OXH96_04290 [Spirochaetaceae bacterium]|nr:hypothetical protein [Spirochaetaceae bacterium]